MGRGNDGDWKKAQLVRLNGGGRHTWHANYGSSTGTRGGRYFRVARTAQPKQVQAMKSQVLFVINRRQYGLNYVDRDAANNTALYVRYGIPMVSMIFQFTDVLARAVKPKRFMRTQ